MNRFRRIASGLLIVASIAVLATCDLIVAPMPFGAPADSVSGEDDVSPDNDSDGTPQTESTEGAGVTVAPTTIGATEGGADGSYTVVLNSAPAGDVVVTAAGGAQISIDPVALTFTSATWDTPRTVTVTAVDDAVAEGTHTDTITHAATSGDADYNGITTSDVSVNITDNEFIVTYDANGATAGTPPSDPNTYAVGNAITVLTESDLSGPLIQDGITQRFTGWNTESNGSGTSYLPGDTPTPSGNITLYAQWTTDTSVVGKVGPAGGWVFYDDDGIYVLTTGRYLEAAPTDLTGIAWGPDNLVSTTPVAVGTGKANTGTIDGLFPGNASAAGETVLLDYGGPADWYLPSLNELDLMYQNLHVEGIGGFESDYYWSSSEVLSNTARYQSFIDGSPNVGNKAVGLRVRAAREF